MSWETFIKKEQEQPYYNKLQCFLYQERQQKIIFPKETDVFKAFELCAYDDVKVVILGQDPYHNENQAHGLSFSVQKGVKYPPSLQNIFKELHADIGCSMPKNNGDLTYWAKQGVLLLNTVLTVEKGKPNSHATIGWEQFTTHVIDYLNEKSESVIFILWGNYAQKKSYLITNEKHIILKSAHPSPLSAYRGFFGSKPFSQINAILQKNNKKPIDWQL